MKIRMAFLVYQRDEVRVEITDVSLRSAVVPELVGAVCMKLGDRLCSPPDWAYRVRWGPEDPEFGFADKSLGSLWYRFGQWSHLLFWNEQEVVATIPVTHEWVRENWPDHSLDEVDEMADDAVQ